METVLEKRLKHSLQRALGAQGLSNILWVVHRKGNCKGLSIFSLSPSAHIFLFEYRSVEGNTGQMFEWVYATPVAVCLD